MFYYLLNKNVNTTRPKLVVQQRVGLLLMSKVKLKVFLRSKVLKQINMSNLNKKIKLSNNSSLQILNWISVFKYTFKLLFLLL